jgi:hypothetical protein
VLVSIVAGQEDNYVAVAETDIIGGDGGKVRILEETKTPTAIAAMSMWRCRVRTGPLNLVATVWRCLSESGARF